MKNRPLLTGFGLVALYVLLAAGLGNLLNVVFPTGSGLGDFAVGHFPAVLIAIAIGLWYVRKTGRSASVWRGVPTYKQDRRRRWMLAIPVLLAAQLVIQAIITPWSGLSFGYISVILLGTLVIGIGEELYFRGILRDAAERHHGELVTLLAVSVSFGLAHAFGSIFTGIPAYIILFQVLVTGMNGVLFYGAFKATGRLWVVMLLHGLNDFFLFAQQGFDTQGGLTAGDTPGEVAIVPVEYALIALAIALIVSSIRKDLRVRKERTMKDLKQN